MSEQQTDGLPANQVLTLLGRIVEFGHMLDEMPTDHRQWVIQHSREAMQVFVDAVRRHRARESMQSVGPFLIQSVKMFLPSTAFMVSLDPSARVRVSGCSQDFVAHFLGSRTEMVETIPVLALGGFRAAAPVEYLPWLNDRGPWWASEISLGAFWTFFSGKGDLGYRVFAAVTSPTGKQVLVGARWHEGGWYFEAILAQNGNNIPQGSVFLVRT